MRNGTMKKLVVVCILLVCVLAFVGCGRTTDKGNKKKTESVYDVLNDIIKVNYSVVELDVTVTNSERLNGKYISTAIDGGYRVEYKYERINTFTEVDGEIIAPEEYKSELSGSAIVKNGAITEQSGAELSVPLSGLTAANFKFKKDYFENVTEKDGEFTALKVKNIKAFLGETVACADMSVVVTYTKTELKSVSISYVTSEHNQTLLTYTFKK